MPIVMFTTTNPLQDEPGKILTLVRKCRCIVITKHTYSMYDLVTGRRLLFKIFGAKEGQTAFNTDDPFDVFRQLGEYAHDHLYNPEIVSPFVAFVRFPLRPIVLQRVGIGVPYDITIENQNYIFVNGEYKPFGYEIIFDLTELYKLGRILVDYKHKKIFVPGTEIFSRGTVCGTTLDCDTLTSPIENIWVIPKLQCCPSFALANNFSFYKNHLPLQ